MRRFTYVNYYDSFQGHHPNVFVPQHHEPPTFESIEEINAYLLSHKQVIDRIHSEGGGKALFLMFDESVEKLAREAGLEVAFPAASLRTRLDSKIETTRLGNDAGVPSVPNVLGRARSYEGLVSLARGADLGDDLVVQTPYGDSGQTTFFIASRDDWYEHSAKLVDEHLKVMKRISCREAAIEGVITRHGTLVGPLMTELTGYPELTPYGGGWCGNDVFATALTERHRLQAREYTKRMGERLRQEGYRGYFELDFLADTEGGELYLGELNPRVTGASSMTNVTAVAYGDMPLFLFHLLEFMDVDYEIDVDSLNEAWAQPSAIDDWSQFILKDTADKVELITEAPQSGIWRLDPGAHGGIRFVRRETDWHTVADENEAFYLRIAQDGGYRYPGADIGILVTRGRLQTDDHQLTDGRTPGSPGSRSSSGRRRPRDRSRCRFPSRSRSRSRCSDRRPAVLEVGEDQAAQLWSDWHGIGAKDSWRSSRRPLSDRSRGEEAGGPGLRRFGHVRKSRGGLPVRVGRLRGGRSAAGTFESRMRRRLRCASMDVLVLQHIACEPPGVFEDVLLERGAVIHRVELDEGEPLPDDPAAFAAVIAMGGPMSVNDEATHPWLVAEKRFIRETVVGATPFWGSCLGVQLLASSLGAEVSAGGRPEVGVLPVYPTEAARRIRCLPGVTWPCADPAMARRHLRASGGRHAARDLARLSEPGVSCGSRRLRRPVPRRGDGRDGGGVGAHPEYRCLGAVGARRGRARFTARRLSSRRCRRCSRTPVRCLARWIDLWRYAASTEVTR